jgi:hypothetical protein
LQPEDPVPFGIVVVVDVVEDEVDVVEEVVVVLEVPLQPTSGVAATVRTAFTPLASRFASPVTFVEMFL